MAQSGEDFTDSYSHADGYIYILRKIDHTGFPTDYYRIEVHPTRRAKSRGNRLQQIMETHVTDMSKAESALREAFGYAYHQSTEEGWFMADSREEVESRYKEVIETWKNTE